MRTATGDILPNSTSFPFKLAGSLTERVAVARLGQEYVFHLEPDPTRKTVQIDADALRAKIDKTQASYAECGFWRRLQLNMTGRWFAEEVDTNAGFIKVGCTAKGAVQMALPITLPVTEYLYDPLGKPRPQATRKQANILVNLDDLQKALGWCDIHANG